MKLPFWRTGVVDISDAELIVLDVLADHGALRFGHLSDDKFDLRFNCDSHHLSDSALSALLERWLQAGWIERVLIGDDERVGITVLGGEQWERERLPDWSRLVCAQWRYIVNRPNQIMTSYFGTSATIVDAYFATWTELSGANALRIRRARLRRQKDLYSWKALGSLAAIVAIEPDCEATQIDWARYRQRRVWWRDTAEIMQSRCEQT